jgi:hypothetical protein
VLLFMCIHEMVQHNMIMTTRLIMSAVQRMKKKREGEVDMMQDQTIRGDANVMLHLHVQAGLG